MQVSVSATHDMKFQALAPNGTVCPIGASEKVGGDGSGFRPMELLLGAMASCAVIDTVLILKKMQVPFERIDIEVDGDRVDATPAPFSNITVKFQVKGASPDHLPKVEKAVKLSVEKYCSVAASLDPKIAIRHLAEIAA